jgi:mxaK protein
VATRLKTKNRALLAALAIGIAGAAYQAFELQEIATFNRAVATGKSPAGETQRFEARFSAAYWLAREGRYQDATQLFTQLMEADPDPQRQAAVQYNLGNIFFLRGLMVNRNGDEVRDEAEYLLTQAKIAYQQSLRLDNTPMDARHNLDRVLRMLPENASAQDEQDQLGIVMGNIPTGLP